MPDDLRVQSPPPKPLLVFDGDCGFCRRWIARWKRATGEAVDYQPFQDDAVTRQYPEIPRADFEHSVHLILPDGSVYRGADAVFRSLAAGGKHRWMAALYRKMPSFADLSELLYEEVALHRTFFSQLDRVYSGPGTEPPSYLGVRFLFLRGLALIYLIAFVSFWVQMPGLIGSHGIAPAQHFMAAVRAAIQQQHLGLERFHAVPTFAWWSASDGALQWQCGLGAACSAALLVGIAPAPMLFLLWALYLSLCVISSPFLNFQWDILLLETGFLAIFFAPWQWIERPSRQAHPPALVLWLFRWLLFRLMFESGCVKLMSGDISWWNLTALKVHFETQPLPTWIGWYAHQLPAAVQAASQFMMLIIELAVPALIFCGRRCRLLAAGVFALFQLIILLTGNYGFFNWLTILLCVPLLDDRAILPRKAAPPAAPAPPAAHPRRWPWWVTLPLAVMIVVVTLIQTLASARVNQTWPAPVLKLYVWLEPLRSFNNYGLFAVMTQTRPEIVVEGSDDGRNWQAYQFKYKPGDLARAPEFVAPYQPRLDWQMWFAALGDPGQRPWFFRFELRLLQNSPEVLTLLGRNPFPKAPPRYVRALLYEYHFTNLATRRATGRWWRRELKGLYAAPLSLEDFRGLPAAGM